MAAEEPLQDPRRDPLRRKLSDRFADFEAEPRPDLRAGILASAVRPAATAGQWRVLGFLLGLLLISVRLDAPLSPPRTPIGPVTSVENSVIQKEHGSTGLAPLLISHSHQRPVSATPDRQPIQPPGVRTKPSTPDGAGYVAARKQVGVRSTALPATDTDPRFPAYKPPLAGNTTQIAATDRPHRRTFEADSLVIALNFGKPISADLPVFTRASIGDVQPLSIRPFSNLPINRLAIPISPLPVLGHPVQRDKSGRMSRWRVSVGAAPLLTYQEVVIPNTAGQVLVRRNQVGALSGERFGYQVFIQAAKQLRPGWQ